MVHHMKQRADDADGQRAANTEDHIANLTDGVIGEQTLHIFLNERHRHADKQRHSANDHHKRADRGTGLDIVNLRHDSNREADAENFLQRGGEQREEWRLRILRSQRNPAMKRNCARFAECAEQHQHATNRAKTRNGQA
ncbi:hypothetical protein SDC9_135927 [bioreactor metagenome]|uniref:Uncharacterized protein n=1 Tax=bioreactor metagenome TaxID=1076179 RepID=A0A645DJ30_9ZZZZ